MSKALRKAITRRTKFKNIYNKCRTESNWSNYEKKKKVCVTLLRKDKAKYLQKLNVDLSDIKTFWKTMKSYFSKQRFEFK